MAQDLQPLTQPADGANATPPGTQHASPMAPHAVIFIGPNPAPGEVHPLEGVVAFHHPTEPSAGGNFGHVIAKFPVTLPNGLGTREQGLVLRATPAPWISQLRPKLSRLASTFRVRLDRSVSLSLPRRLSRGITDQGEFVAADYAAFLEEEGTGRWMELRLRPRSQMTVRRLLRTFGVEPQRIVRTAIGPIILGTLPPGAMRPLTPEEAAVIMIRADSPR